MKTCSKSTTLLIVVLLAAICLASTIVAIFHGSESAEPTLQTEVPATQTEPSTPAATVPQTTEAVFPSATQSTVPPATQSAVPAPELTASHAFLCRWSDGTFLFNKGSLEERIYPASITKLLVAYVALQHLSADQNITVGTAIYTVPPDSSLAFLSIGDVLTVEQLIYGMLLPSGGDAARVIAAEAGRALNNDKNLSDTDAINLFMEEVNRQALILGMTDTHFVTPDGFHDPEHYTTMADLILLAKLCLEDPLLQQVVNATEYTVTLAGHSATWYNTNMLLKASSSHPEFYRETAIGLKTGYTNAAGRCLLAAFVVDGETYLAGVFGCPDPNFGFIAQFENICKLYDTYLVRP